MTTSEYSRWVDALMNVRGFDALRAPNLGALDPAAYWAGWQEAVRDKAVATAALPEAGTRIVVYWPEDEDTDAGTWYGGVVKSHRKNNGRVESHLVYDAVGPWQRKQDLSYWHVLADETWEVEAE